MDLRKKIIEILIKHQENCKVGSDGDYETITAVWSEDYGDVADDIVKLGLSAVSLDEQSEAVVCPICEKEKELVNNLYCQDCNNGISNGLGLTEN